MVKVVMEQVQEIKMIWLRYRKVCQRQSTKNAKNSKSYRKYMRNIGSNEKLEVKVNKCARTMHHLRNLALKLGQLVLHVLHLHSRYLNKLME